MAYPTVVYNNTTGSNTGASGAPAGMTAVNSTTTGQTVSGAAGGTTLTFSAAVDLTGIAVDGSDVIFVHHSLDERYLFAISAISGTVSACTGVTLAQAVGATAISGANWAVGGKRKDAQLQDGTGGNSIHIESEDWVAGWTAQFDNGETFTIAGTDTLSMPAGTNDLPITVTASDPTDAATLPLFQTANNLSMRSDSTTYGFFGGNVISTGTVVIDGLKFERTSGSWNGSWCLDFSCGVQIRRCRVEGGVGLVGFTTLESTGGVIENNFLNFGSNTTSTAYCIDGTNNRPATLAQYNTCILGTSMGGIYFGGSTYTGKTIKGNTIIGGTTAIKTARNNGFALVTQNTCYNQSGDAIIINDGGNYFTGVIENIVSNAGGYAVSIPAAAGNVFCDYNHFFSNTSGNYSAAFVGFTAGPNDTSGDPGFASTTSPYDLTPSNTPPLQSGPVGPTGS